MSIPAGAFDVAIVGAGICGLAHALAAARRGKRVIVVDRDAQANGASVRNFGFITVTGQQNGDCWRRARRSRDVWVEIASAAGIPVLQRGLLTIARRPEARGVLEQFLATEMGAECELVEPGEIEAYGQGLRTQAFAGALFSPHEIRVESREAIPRLAAYLAERFGVTFWRETVAHVAAPPRLETSRGTLEAETIIVCPGDDFHTLRADRIAAYGLTRCKLHMMRLEPDRFDEKLPAVMSDLGMIRYLGYSELPAAAALEKRLQAEQGDAHRQRRASDRRARSRRFARRRRLPPLCRDARSVRADPCRRLDPRRIRRTSSPVRPPGITERWTGTYASAKDRLMLVDKPSDALRIVLITSGTGASTSFAIAEEVVADLFGPA